MNYNKLDIRLGQELIKLVAEVDEFKGHWEALKTLAPERLNKLRKVAAIESVGSSTRIEGAKLSDTQVKTLLSNLETQSFQTRDEQEVAGYGFSISGLGRYAPYRKQYPPIASDTFTS